jgi:hypothetical protein
MILNRFQAGAIHLATSIAVAAAIFLPIYFVWFPGVLFESAGGRELFLLIACVDVTLGPLVTTIVYRHGKRGMKFDLVVIAILQLTALGYGVSVLFESRPVFIVYVKDRFELVRASEVSESDMGVTTPATRGPFSVTGPMLVGARLPSDPEERYKLSISGLAGVDVQRYPQYYVPYEQVRGEARELAKPIARLRQLNPDAKGVIDRVVAANGPEDGLAFLPMRAGKRDLSVIISKRTGDVLAYLSQRPWEY